MEIGWVATGKSGILDTIEGVARYAHDSTGLRSLRSSSAGFSGPILCLMIL